ncbi:MAG TPA: hypothetical protein PLN21_07300 [Gemmatales bacterium]|nr:hypothetical protein [Gemmatales bacterium]
MKLDKETMIKQRFWFLLPVFAICILVGWICVLGVRGETETNYKTANDKNNALNKLAGEKEIKNQPWIDAMGKELEVSSAKKQELWLSEYDRQNKVVRDAKDPSKLRRMAPFFTWPEKTRMQWAKTNQGRDLYSVDYGEYMGIIPSDEYREEFLPQYQAVVDIIHDWLNESNPNNVTGAVRVLGAKDKNQRNDVIPNLLKPHLLNVDKHLLSDEVHLLQEDLAVKREIFLSIADLLDSYSKLKPEWYEVPFVEINEVSAPAAPAAPSAAPAVDAQPRAQANPGATVDAPKKSTEPEIFQKKRFYNYIWPNLLNPSEVAEIAKLKPTLIDYGLPVTDPYKGWRIDLAVGQDPQNENKLVLNVVSANHSDLFSIPSIPLVIWYSELGSEQEVATPLYLNDAGNLGPCEFWPNATIKKLSQKKLKDIPLPPNFGKVTRITRVLPENTVDQRIDFNHEWVVNVQLVRRSNNPVRTLKAEVINRSGRRLPVATFTAGLSLPNSTSHLNEDFKVATDAFNAGERRSVSLEIKNPVQPQSISTVRQKLTWRSTPIKRIDRLEVGKAAHEHSDRLKTIPLKSYDFKRKDPLGLNTVSQPVAASGDTGATNLGGAASASTQNANTVTPNQGVPLNRYVQISPELRRMPVALVMVVDATAITDIIAAMSNSKLRFQVTMAPWVRVPNLGRPGGTVVAAAGSGNTAPGASSAPASGSSVSGTNISAGAAGNRVAPGLNTGMTGGEPSTRGAAGGARGATGAGGTDVTGTGGKTNPNRQSAGILGLEDDSSVVELQIYGIVTIYESPDDFKRIQQLKANSSAQPAGGTPPGK